MNDLSQQKFYKLCVGPLVRSRAEKQLADVQPSAADVDGVVAACAAAYERVRRDDPQTLRIDGLAYEARAHQRLLAHRAFVVVRPTFDREVDRLRKAK
jgi:hypothetical protein